MTAWLLPTARATAWPPLAGVATCFAGMGLVAMEAEVWPVGLLGIGAAALAAALVAGLHDPAAALLSAVPTSPGRRRVQRLTLLLPCGLAVWLLFVASGHLSAAALDPGWPLGQVAALTATGLAVAVWAPEGYGVQAGVTAPLLWYAVSWASGSIDGAAAHVVSLWQHHPWILSVAALAALVLGRRR